MLFSSLSTSLFSFNLPFSKNLFNSLTSISNIFTIISMSRRNRTTTNISTSFSNSFPILLFYKLTNNSSSRYILSIKSVSIFMLFLVEEDRLEDGYQLRQPRCVIVHRTLCDVLSYIHVVKKSSY